MEARIAAVGAYVPPRRMSNNDIAQLVETSDEWIYSHTGIRNRHIADESVAASDLAVEAATRALAAASVAPDQVDLILVATSTPDFPGLPSTASIVQDRIGSPTAGAMDVVAACTGFVYGLETARAFVVAGSARTVLVIGSEVFSKIIDWKDRNTCVLFGDGAGAVLVLAEKPIAGGKPTGLIDSVLRSRGSGADALLRPGGGSRHPLLPDEHDHAESKLAMDGRRVYIFAVQAIVESIHLLLERNGLTINDIDHIVPHQANIRIIEAACNRANLPFEKFFTNIEEYANTSAASIPIALGEMVSGGLLKRGELIITVGFGAGLTYGANLVRW